MVRRKTKTLSKCIQKTVSSGEHVNAASRTLAGDAFSRSSLTAAQHKRKQCTGRGQLELSAQSDHGRSVARRCSRVFGRAGRWPQTGTKAPPAARTGLRHRGRDGAAARTAAMDAALLLRDARRDSGCPAVILTGAFALTGP